MAWLNKLNGPWVAFVAVCLMASSMSAAVARGLPDFTQLVEESSPSVVNISTSQKRRQIPGLPKGFEIPNLPKDSPFNEYFRRYFGDQEPDQLESQSLGSGFIVSPDGYIISNNHVVRDADQIIVRLSDRRQFTAKVVGTDERSDIALLKIDAEGLPVARLGRGRELKVGEWVLAIGSPFGFDYSVTAGIVSAKRRALPRENYVPFIQTDVAINPGNSGGPLFNLNGEVVGVNSQIFSRTGGFMGLSFAIPIDVAMNVVDQLRSKGSVTRGWLGVLIQDVTRELAESFSMARPEGALIAKVLADSPAKKGGIQVGDIVLSYNGMPVYRSSDLPPIVGSSPTGRPADVVILRSGPGKGDTVEHKRLTLKIVTGELPSQRDLGQLSGARPQQSDRAQVLGGAIVDLTDEQREKLQVSSSGGVVVSTLEEGPLRAAGVKPGDVILKFNHLEIKNSAHFAEIANDLPAGKNVALYLLREGAPQFLPLKIAPSK
jgi:serine protease Do